MDREDLGSWVADRPVRPDAADHVHVYRFDGAGTAAAAMERLGLVAGFAPGALPLGLGAHGKPFLDGSPWRFNLSHSHGIRLLAVAHGLEVGVDIERIRPLRRRAALLARCFTARERARLEEAPDRELLRHWAAKEALVKAIGRGIAYGLGRIEIARSAEGTLSIARCEGPGGPASRWRLVELPTIDDAVAMLVQQAPGRPVRCMRAADPSVAG
jgi:4'-phosphopantetheinyl transferase